MTSSQSDRPLTCPNGHAMDEDYFECPACGAYRPSAAQREIWQDIKRAQYDAKVRAMERER